jgi:transcriptional regulator with XRE-family HTH domain
MDATIKKPKVKTKSRQMKPVGKTFASVSDLVRDSSDAEFAREFDEYQARRKVVNCLTAIRCAKEVTQAQLAERMRCGQPKISKIESSEDADLDFGDIISYVNSLGMSVHIAFAPDKRNGADHIRFHVECIKQELDRLVRIAGSDESIGNGVEAFAIETIQKMISMIEESIHKLPHRAQQSSSPLSVEVEGDRGQSLLLNRAKRVSGLPRKAKATT